MAPGSADVIACKLHLVFDFSAGALFAVLAIAGGFEATTAVLFGVIGVAVMLVAMVTQIGDERVPATV